MLQADAESRRRLTVLVGAIVVIILCVTLPGLWQRFFPAPDETPVDSVALRENAKRTRAIRESLGTLGREGRWAELVSSADKSLKESDPFLLNQLRAEALFHLGDERAGSTYAELLPDDSVMNHAIRLALKGKNSDYAKFCAEQIGKQDLAKLPTQEANNVAWFCVYAPEALENYDPVVALAERAVKEAPAEGDRLLYLNTLGAIQVRAGQHEAGIKSLLECEKKQTEPFNWPFLALAYAHQGKKDEARRWQVKLEKYLTESFGQPGLDGNRHELLLFQQQVKEALAR